MDSSTVTSVIYDFELRSLHFRFTKAYLRRWFWEFRNSLGQRRSITSETSSTINHVCLQQRLQWYSIVSYTLYQTVCLRRCSLLDPIKFSVYVQAYTSEASRPSTSNQLYNPFFFFRRHSLLRLFAVIKLLQQDRQVIHEKKKKRDTNRIRANPQRSTQKRSL